MGQVKGDLPHTCGRIARNSSSFIRDDQTRDDKDQWE